MRSMDTTPTERHALPGVGELVGSSRSNRAWRRLKCTGLTPALFLVALMAGPVVMYLALVHHAEREALKDARAFSSMISIVRSYYASNVTGRIMAAGGVQVSLSENYREIAGACPSPRRCPSNWATRSAPTRWTSRCSSPSFPMRRSSGGRGRR